MLGTQGPDTVSAVMVQILTLSLTNCVIWGKFAYISIP